MFWIRQVWEQLSAWTSPGINTVRPRTLGDEFVDRGYLVPHLMFEVLGRFLEEECGDEGVVDWDAREDDRLAMAEMRELWRWWNEEYLKFSDEKFYDGVEEPQLVEGPEEILPGGVTAREFDYEWSSPEAGDAFSKACIAAADAKEAMEAELRSRCKRLIDITPFMWT